MGNVGSQLGALRAAILANDVAEVQNVLVEFQSRRGTQTASELLWQPMNRKGDAALSFAVRRGHLEISRLLLQAGSNINLQNRHGETALDLALSPVLPSDGDILHQHFCPYSHHGCDGGEVFTALPEIAKMLLLEGALGSSLEKVILHAMMDSERLSELINLIPNLLDHTLFRTSALLLQVTVWFHQTDNLEMMLRRGVDPTGFWGSPFMPGVGPNTSPPPPSIIREWGSEDEDDDGQAGQNSGGEYYLPEVIQQNDHNRSLRLTFVQDWCADWNDGDNPDAQFRAGLQVTPDGAIVFTRAAHSPHILCLIMGDVMSYIPESCSGPELNQTDLIGCMLLAGYRFSGPEIQHLELNFNIDFEQYKEFRLQPKTLKHLSRLRIRQSVTTNVYHALEGLEDVPRTIKDYILLKVDYPPKQPLES